MANHRTKKCKRQVRCTMCTDVRWRGNRKGRRKAKEEAKIKTARKVIHEVPSEVEEQFYHW
jgi:hypothetical protein